MHSALIVLAVASASGALRAQTIELVSSGAGGVLGDSGSLLAQVSADGRYVAFTSFATNLVSGDTNGEEDIFIRDRSTGVVERVSVSSSGAEANGPSSTGGLSADGRFVGFTSAAGNLDSADSNGLHDVFVRDRVTGVTERVSLSSNGQQLDATCSGGLMTPDGRFVLLFTAASNAVVGDTNQWNDVFVRDRSLATTRRVSVASGGMQADGPSNAASISADGRFVAFQSWASNLIAGSSSGQGHVFVHDCVSGATELVSATPTGAYADGASQTPVLSADGRVVGFWSSATNLIAGPNGAPFGLFVRDRLLGVTERVTFRFDGSPDNGAQPSLSADGRFVAYESTSSFHVPGDTNGWRDVFVRDRTLRITERVSLAWNGEQSAYDCDRPALSADGRWVAFHSFAGNLTAGDVNLAHDIFLADRGAGLVRSYCMSMPNSLGCVPTMGALGAPSASSPSMFLLQAVDVLNHKSGLLFYGSRPQSVPFRGGTLCVAAPTRRTSLQNSGGNLGASDCSGAYSFDLNAHIQSGVDPGLVVGAYVFAQYWSRDPASPWGTHLTDAVSLKVEP